jgi:hypothetical protein
MTFEEAFNTLDALDSETLKIFMKLVDDQLTMEYWEGFDEGFEEGLDRAREREDE